jgi:hypothetical protein
MLNDSRMIRRLLWLPLAIFLILPQGLVAGETETHVVTSAELRKEIVTASEARKANLQQVRNFFNSGPAKRALESAGVEPKKIERAAASLADEELARLAQRTVRVERDFAAGALSNLHLTYIVIALAAAVLVLVLK